MNRASVCKREQFSTLFAWFAVWFLIMGFGLEAAQPSPLLSPELLSEAGFELNWEIHLPVKTAVGEKLERLYVFDPYLVVLTNQNFLFCRDRLDGSRRFEMQIAESRLPVAEPLYLEGRLFFLVGSRLIIVDPSVGAVIRKEDLGEAAASRGVCLARNERFVYVAGADHRLHAYQIQEDGDHVELFSATADDDSAITSILATSEQVFFATTSGAVVAMKTDEPVKLWQYNCSGPITASLVLDGGVLYAAGEDTKLYKLDASTGKMLWAMPFFAGQKILHTPVVGRSLVYLNAGRNGLFGVSKESGQEVWNVPSGQSLLCESGQKAYIFAAPAVIVVMDNTRGRPLYSMNAAGVTHCAVNQVDAKIYLADEEGRAACLSVR